MKSLILAVCGIGVVAGAFCYLKGTQELKEAPNQPGKETVSVPAAEVPRASEPVVAASAPSSPVPIVREPAMPPPVPITQVNEPTLASSKSDVDKALVRQAIETLVSTQVAYHRKQEAWKRLRDQGQLDRTIKELEQRMADDPQTAAYPTALGQAYFKKCATLKDTREQAIMAMQADKVLDVALDIDPANWEARFTKAVAMSYWPASMNKGTEVIEHFRTLIGQQEGQMPQPHFADTYVILGDQYQKVGRADYARLIWERGAGMFPTDNGLKQKLASAPVASSP